MYSYTNTDGSSPESGSGSGKGAFSPGPISLQLPMVSADPYVRVTHGQYAVSGDHFPQPSISPTSQRARTSTQARYQNVIYGQYSPASDRGTQPSRSSQPQASNQGSFQKINYGHFFPAGDRVSQPAYSPGQQQQATSQAPYQKSIYGQYSLASGRVSQPAYSPGSQQIYTEGNTQAPYQKTIYGQYSAAHDTSLQQPIVQQPIGSVSGYSFGARDAPAVSSQLEPSAPVFVPKKSYDYLNTSIGGSDATSVPSPLLSPLSNDPRLASSASLDSQFQYLQPPSYQRSQSHDSVTGSGVNPAYSLSLAKEASSLSLVEGMLKRASFLEPSGSSAPSSPKSEQQSLPSGSSYNSITSMTRGGGGGENIDALLAQFITGFNLSNSTSGLLPTSSTSSIAGNTGTTSNTTCGGGGGGTIGGVGGAGGGGGMSIGSSTSISVSVDIDSYLDQIKQGPV